MDLSEPMRIVMRDPLHGRSPNAWYWSSVLAAIAGETLVVETKHLFKDQFNTAGMHDEEVSRLIGKIGQVSDDLRKRVRDALAQGLRIMESDVVKVINDVRPAYMRCNYCGLTQIKPVNQQQLGVYWCECCSAETVAKYGMELFNRRK